MGADLVCPCPYGFTSSKVCAAELPTKNIGKIRFVETTPTQMPILEMNSEQKNCLMTHFRETINQRPDIFHKVMLQCMQSSPKINEIIACQMYCYRDLTKWPKLNSLCQSQLNFYDRLIYVLKLDESALSEAVYGLGVVHYRYAKFGLKPHFLDLWQQQMEQQVNKLKFTDPEQKKLYCESFSILNQYITSTVNLAYSRCQMEHMLFTKNHGHFSS